MENNYKIEYWDKEKTKIRSEEWFNSNGEYHRVDGPAYQSWYENGPKHYESWYLDGKYHRLDGPAVLRWFENGQKHVEYWYSVQYWYENGQKSIESWYLDGKELSEREIVVLKRKRKLRSINID